MTTRIQSVERAIDVLRVLAAGPQTVTTVANATGLAKGTVSRLLASLTHARFVVREAGSRRYMLGPGLLGLVAEVKTTFGWVGALAGPVLNALRDETGETITVHIRIGMERVCVDELPSPHPLRYTASVGSVDSLHIGSAGRVLLAFMDERERENTIAALRLDPVTENTITDRDALRREIELTRERGWAISIAERTQGSAALSVPVHGLDSVAALSVLSPKERLTRDRCEQFLPRLREASKAIEAMWATKVIGGT